MVHVLRSTLPLSAVKASLPRPDLSWLAVVILFGVPGPLLLVSGLATCQESRTAPARIATVAAGPHDYDWTGIMYDTMRLKGERYVYRNGLSRWTSRTPVL